MSMWQVDMTMFCKSLFFTYLAKAIEAALATVLSTTEVYSSITAFDFILRAKSALNFSPFDNTSYGLYQEGIELKPTEPNLLIPSCQNNFLFKFESAKYNYILHHEETFELTDHLIPDHEKRKFTTNI
jgi:hypothetical protein